MNEKRNFDYKRLHPFKWYILENFPFLEDSIDVLTNYQLFCKLGEMYNKQVDAINTLGVQVEGLTDWFDDLDVQEEINNKLDNMAIDGTLENLIGSYIQPRIDAQNQNINAQNQTINNFINNSNTKLNIMENDVETIKSQFSSLASGSPLVATSTSQMLDTSRIYVNTTDGKWYYYNGTAWTIGGDYQSTGIAAESIDPEKTTFYNIQNFIPLGDWIIGKVYFATDGHLASFHDGDCAYNPKQISVTPGDVFIAYNYSEAMGVRVSYWDSNNTYLSTGIINDNAISILTIPAHTAYIKFSVYTKGITSLPPQVFMYKLSDYMSLQNDKYATIKKECFNDLNTDDILIPNNKVKFFPKIYGHLQASSYSLNINNNKFVLNSTYTGSTTNYTGPYFKMQNVSAGDTLYIKTNASRLAMYKSNIANDQVETTTPLWEYSFNSSNIGTIIVTQNMIDWLNASTTNALCLTTAVAVGITNFNLEVEFLTAKGRTLTDFINDYDNSKETLSCIVLGDSITALTGNRSWLTYFTQIQPINVIQNVAVNGAHLTDYNDTIYDGNPVFNGADNNHNNVLGNQVQKIINNNYSDPDIIMIAIGTNDGIECTEQEIYNSYYDSTGNLIPLSNVDRTTAAGAYRYCNERLRTLYPNATIFWCSPIQAVNSSRNLNDVIVWSKNLEALTKYSSSQFIDSEKCGITGYTEISGQNGLYLIDGLHPNKNGAKYLGYYNATKVKEYCDECKLLNN